MICINLIEEKYKSRKHIITLTAHSQEKLIKMFSVVKVLSFIFLISLQGVNCAKVTLEQMQQASEPIRMVRVWSEGFLAH